MLVSLSKFTLMIQIAFSKLSIDIHSTLVHSKPNDLSQYCSLFT